MRMALLTSVGFSLLIKRYSAMDVELIRPALSIPCRNNGKMEGYRAKGSLCGYVGDSIRLVRVVLYTLQCLPLFAARYLCVCVNVLMPLLDH